MTEARGLSVLLLASLGVFLTWGLDAGWRLGVIRMESRWLIESFDTRAYALGTAADQALQRALGPLVAQGTDSWGEGWVMGLRQVITRIGAQGPLWPLLALGVLGVIMDAECQRKRQSAHFFYTSPLHYQRLQGLLRVLVMGAFWILLAPIPVHPLFLLSILMVAAWVAARYYAAYMKQI